MNFDNQGGSEVLAAAGVLMLLSIPWTIGLDGDLMVVSTG